MLYRRKSKQGTQEWQGPIGVPFEWNMGSLKAIATHQLGKL